MPLKQSRKVQSDRFTIWMLITDLKHKYCMTAAQSFWGCNKTFQETCKIYFSDKWLLTWKKGWLLKIQGMTVKHILFVIYLAKLCTTIKLGMVKYWVLKTCICFNHWVTLYDTVMCTIFIFVGENCHTYARNSLLRLAPPVIFSISVVKYPKRHLSGIWEEIR